MENKWKTISFDQICDITRGASPRPIQEHPVDNGTPWVKIADATKSPSRYITDTKEFIKPASEKNSRIVYPGELIVSNSATPALPRFLKIRACVHDGWLILRNIRNVCPEFLYYKIEKEREALLMKGNGAIFTNLKTEILKEHEIQLPPLPEQKAIASVLSSLDDKIDLLHQQNQTLEALAEALFRRWFIEEAKEDWEERPLSSIANFLNGLACQKFPPKDSINRLPVLKIKDLTSGISENSDWATTDVKPEYIIRNGDVIFAWSASLMVKIWNGEDCILNQHLFKVTSEEFPKWFYYFWCKQHLREFIAIAQSHATTMGHIKRGDLDEAMVLIPEEKEIEKMTIQMNPILERIQLNNNQINSLSKLRDTLLPKLMSGEVRVKM